MCLLASHFLRFVSSYDEGDRPEVSAKALAYLAHCCRLSAGGVFEMLAALDAIDRKCPHGQGGKHAS